MIQPPPPPATVLARGRERLPARLHTFRPRLLDALEGYDRRSFMADAGAGITVGIVALPLAMAFAIASGVKPEQGIFTAIIAGFLISALGGSNVQIGGPAGAFIVIVYGIVQRYGVANLIISTVLAGGLLLALGWFKLGALVRLIPISIVIGFTNGIAVLIAVSQLKDLLGLNIEKVPADFFAQAHAIGLHAREANRMPSRSPAAGDPLCAGWPRYLHRPPCRSAGRPPRSSRRARARPCAADAVPASVPSAPSSLAVRSALPVSPSQPLRGIPSHSRPSSGRLHWDSVHRCRSDGDDASSARAIAALRPRRRRRHRQAPRPDLRADGAGVATSLRRSSAASPERERSPARSQPRPGRADAVQGSFLCGAGHRPVARPLAPACCWPCSPHPAVHGLEHGQWPKVMRPRAFPRVPAPSSSHLLLSDGLPPRVHAGAFQRLRRVVTAVPRSFASARGLSRRRGAVYSLYGALFFAAVAKLEAVAEELPPGTTALVLDAHQLVSTDASGLDAIESLHRTLARMPVRLIVAGLNEQPLDAMRRSGLDALVGPQNIFADRAAALAPIDGARGRSGRWARSPRIAARSGPRSDPFPASPFRTVSRPQPVGYLDELKRQADEAKARQTQDIGALQRNAMLTDSACQVAARYLNTLAQQLNVLQPASKAVWRFDNRTSFDQLRFSDFRADSRLKKLRYAEVFDHVVLNFAAKTGQRVTLAKDFPPEIEKPESRLRQCGTNYEASGSRPEKRASSRRRFQFVADFVSSVRLFPDHDASLDFQITPRA